MSSSISKTATKLSQPSREARTKPRLLLHACCAPCSTVAISRLREDYELAVFFYGPNIHPPAEYAWRLEELHRLCQELNMELIEGDYKPAVWGQAVRAYRNLPEGSLRCEACYRLRMLECARVVKERNFDLFTVSLTVSRYKNSKLLSEIGKQIAKTTKTTYLVEDFGKKDGYALSIKWSRERGLLRQDYCGCALSRAEVHKRRKVKAVYNASTNREYQQQPKSTGA